LTFARALRVGIDCLNQIAIKIEQQQLFSLGWRIRLGDVLLGSVRTVGAIRVYAARFRKMARCPVPNCLRPSEPKESENLSWYLLPFDRNFSQPASAITPARPSQGRAANDNARVVFGNFRLKVGVRGVSISDFHASKPRRVWNFGRSKRDKSPANLHQGPKWKDRTDQRKDAESFSVLRGTARQQRLGCDAIRDRGSSPRYALRARTGQASCKIHCPPAAICIAAVLPAFTLRRSMKSCVAMKRELVFGL